MDEGTVISKIAFKDRDQQEHTAILTQGDRVYLHIGNSKIEMDTVDSNPLIDTYTMKNVDAMIVVYTHLVTARSYHVNFTIIHYEDEKIERVFSAEDMSCTISGLQMDIGEVNIGFPYADSNFTYLLTNNEREHTHAVLSELKENQININDEFMKSIAENLICSPIALEIADVNNDGKEDVILLTNIHTIGAKTPVRMNANVVFLFEIKDGILQFSHVELERTHEKDLFSYFPEKLVNEK